MAAHSANSSRPFVGREAQLAVADALLNDLDRSNGSLLVLSGEPGIGKTRLTAEILARARARGARTAWATAWQGEGAPPLWPWTQILRQVTGSDPVLDRPAPTTPTTSAAARFAQLEAISRMLLDASPGRPLVAALDDVQWADRGSIRVLTFLAAAVRDAPCMLVAAYRSDELAREYEAELARVGTTVAVPPLEAGAAAELFHAAVGGDVKPTATAAVIDRSNGNPLFVWEFGQLMARAGRFDVAPAAIPGAVAVVIERRLARLAEDELAVLRVAAVAGRMFTTRLVATMADQSIDDVGIRLTAAATTGIVSEAGAQRFAFSHDLVRDVVVDGLDPATKAELHRRAAVALEHRVVTEPSLHAVVADHLSSAGEAHVEAASTHWEQAARHALSVLAYEDAATCYSRAADHCRDDLARNGELLVNEGNAWLLAGDLGQARSRFSAVVTVARVLGDPELFASAVLGIGTGAAGWEVPLASDEYVTLVTEALAFLPADATRMRSMLLARQSVAAATPDTHGPARQRAQEALDLAETIGDPALIGQALAALNDAIAGPGHTISRLQNADTIVEVALAAGDRALELLGYRFRVVADLELGDMAAVDRDIEAFSRLAETIRQPLLSWYVPLFRGMRALLAGDLALADKYHLEVAAAAEATGSHNATMLATTLGLGIDIAAGRPIEPERLEGIADVDPEVWASYAASIAMAHWLAGNHARARELLGLHARNDFARLGDDAEHLTTLTMFGRVASGLGEHAAAEAVYELLLPYSGLWVVDGIAACCWGPTDLELARLALALDRPVEAETHLARAQRSCADAGAVLHAAEVERLADECQARIGHTAPIETDEPPSTDEANRLCREGQFWTLTFRGHTVRMRDAKGLGDLAHLLSSPGREVHVMELAGSAEPGDATGAAVAGAGGDLGELLDARARAEFRRRLAELDDELADAEACADLVRIGNAREEREFLAAELAAALGLGGRPRRAGDPAERARKAVSGRIRMAIGRIDHEHPALARHLTNAVRTGTYCAYEPETTMIWQL